MRQVCPFALRSQSYSLILTPPRTLAPDRREPRAWLESVPPSLQPLITGACGFCLEPPFAPLLTPTPINILFCENNTSSRKPSPSFSPLTMGSKHVLSAPVTLCIYLHPSTYLLNYSCLRQSYWRRTSRTGLPGLEALLYYLLAVILGKSLDLSKPQLLAMKRKIFTSKNYHGG